MPKEQWGKKWSDEETELLKKIYPTSTTEELLEAFPGRSYNSIRLKAYYLGIKKDKGAIQEIRKVSAQKRKLSFSEEEIEIIKKIYPKAGAKGVQKLLPHRSIKSIKNKAHALGVKIDESSQNKWKKDKVIIVKNDIFRVTKIIYKKIN